MPSSAHVQHMSHGFEGDEARKSAFLTKCCDIDELLAGLKAFHENVQLFGQLLPLDAVLFRFTSDAGHDLGGHRSDGNRRKNVVERGNELGFNDFDSDVVDETSQSNLFNYMSRSVRGSVEVKEGGNGGQNKQPCNNPAYNPKLRNTQSGSGQVLCVARLSRGGGDL